MAPLKARWVSFWPLLRLGRLKTDSSFEDRSDRDTSPSIRKRVAINNYHHAFPDRSPLELRRTVGEMVWGYVELLMGKRAEVLGAELAEGGGIALASHTGSWDLALVSGAAKAPLTIFVKPPSNPVAAWIIERVRRRAGVELLPPTGSLLRAHRALEEGRVVVFLLDQRFNKGISVPFFGRPCQTSAAFADMVYRTRAPILGLHQWRDPGGHHLQVQRPHWNIPETREQAQQVLTEHAMRFHEEVIRQRPHSWLWLHDRWR